MNPQNGIVGDDFGTELPQMQVDPQSLVEEKQMAQYADSGEFQRIKDWVEERKAFYQTWLPTGKPLTEVPAEERGYMWLAANVVIGELDSLIASYELAKRVVKEEQGKANARKQTA
jgi:hypothetical protein